MSKITATRYHDFSAGHRVYGHEGKCAHLHGHNYRVHFTVERAVRQVDDLGRVLDFSAIKACLCEWLEREWDHKMLLWIEDPYVQDDGALCGDAGVVPVPFNPTAENMALYLLEKIGPQVLPPGTRLIHVIIEETRKCSASAQF